MKDIRKYMTGLAAAGFVMVASVPTHAAFSSKGTSTVTAAVTTGGTGTIAITSVAIKKRSDNSADTAIGWTGAVGGGGWQVADQYVQVVTNINMANGGLQYYTDNTNGTGASQFKGSISSFTATPAGLVDNTDGKSTIPTAWRASTGTLTSINSVDPTINSGDSFLWFFHEDHAQVANPSLNAGRFCNGDPFVTVYASQNTPLTSCGISDNGTVYQTTAVNSGIHFAQGPTQFGGFVSAATTNLYTEANFATALVGTTYSTTKLILEAFSL